MKSIVIIPSYNAGKTLPELVRRLRGSVPDIGILVVDDGSTDDTATVAQECGVILLQHDRNRGKGAALRSGFDYAKNVEDLDAVITMDADLQHAPEDLPKMIKLRQEKHPNIVLGARNIRGTKMPYDRRFSNILTSFMMRARTGVIIKDSQCGFRLIGREVLDAVELTSVGYEAETEFLIKASKCGFSIMSVPVKTIYGAEKSYMTRWHTTKQFTRILFREF